MYIVYYIYYIIYNTRFERGLFVDQCLQGRQLRLAARRCLPVESSRSSQDLMRTQNGSKNPVQTLPTSTPKIHANRPLRNTASVQQNCCRERSRLHSGHFTFTKHCACAAGLLPRALSPAFRAPRFYETLRLCSGFAVHVLKPPVLSAPCAQTSSSERLDVSKP